MYHHTVSLVFTRIKYCRAQFSTVISDLYNNKLPFQSRTNMKHFDHFLDQNNIKNIK